MPPEKPTTNDNRQPTTDLKRIRTYQSDVEELMRNKQTSKADIALAEGERQRNAMERPVVSSQSEPKVFHISQAIPEDATARRFQFNWRLALLGGGVLLLIVGASFAWRYVATRVYEPSVSEGTPPATEKGDGAIALSGSESRVVFTKMVREKAAAVSVPLNEVRTLAVRSAERFITTEELLSFLDARAPTPLIRALETTPTVGVHGIRGNQLFLLFKVNSFDHAFDGMLLWEKTLLYDLGPLFGVAPPKLEPRGATTTADILESRLVIKDAIIRNRDARAAFDGTGRIVFLYSFLDKETLLIATNEETLKTVLQKARRGHLR